jgi:hypothetical protein
MSTFTPTRLDNSLRTNVSGRDASVLYAETHGVTDEGKRWGECNSSYTTKQLANTLIAVRLISES